MYLENGQAAIPVGPFDGNTAVETSWAQQRFVKPIGPVRSGDHDNSLAHIKTVHLDQQLVQCLLALIVAVDTGATLATHSINFIDKDDAGRCLLGLVEKITHAAGSDAYQHLDKLGAADGEERHCCFTCYGTRQQRLTGSRRAYQQDAAWNLTAQFLELCGRLKKLNHLDEIIFRLVDTRHVGERGTRPVFQHKFGPALAEAEDVLLALGSTPGYEEEHADQEDPG